MRKAACPKIGWPQAWGASLAMIAGLVEVAAARRTPNQAI
jgi:hypothetical protein